jgi:hypothetical protein
MTISPGQTVGRARGAERHFRSGRERATRALLRNASGSAPNEFAVRRCFDGSRDAHQIYSFAALHQTGCKGREVRLTLPPALSVEPHPRAHADREHDARGAVPRPRDLGENT